MNFEELSNLLINREPEDWPNAYRNLAKNVPVPQKIDDAITTAIVSATQKKTSQPKYKKYLPVPNRNWFFAATALLLVLAGIGIFVLWQTEEQTQPSGIIEIVSGSATIRPFSAIKPEMEPSNSETRLVAESVAQGGLLFTAGNRLHSDTNSAVQIRFLKESKFRLGSGSSIILQRNDSKSIKSKIPSASRIHLNLLGECYFKSPKLKSDSEVAMHTPTAIARVRGTEFILSSSNTMAILLVYEGQVELIATTGSKQVVVEAKQRATVDVHGNIRVSQQDFKDQLKHSIYSRIDPIFKKYGTGSLNDELELESEAAIRKHYGKLYLVQLADGREYTGYPSLHGSMLRIHTTYGVIEMDQSDVASFSELQ